MSTCYNTSIDSPPYLSLYHPGAEEPARRPTLCQVSYALGQIRKLTPDARRFAELVYSRLRRDCNQDICLNLSQRYAMRNLGMGERSVRRHIERLERLNIFVVEYLSRAEIVERVHAQYPDVNIDPDELLSTDHKRNIYYPRWDGGGFLGIWPTNTFLSGPN